MRAASAGRCREGGPSYIRHSCRATESMRGTFLCSSVASSRDFCLPTKQHKRRLAGSTGNSGLRVAENQSTFWEIAPERFPVVTYAFPASRPVSEDCGRKRPSQNGCTRKTTLRFAKTARARELRSQAGGLRTRYTKDRRESSVTPVEVRRRVP
jgi:hypothetical protein